jgi:hypothetical protein
MIVVLQMEMRQIPLSLILFPLPSPGLMGWEEERKMASHNIEEKHLVVAVYLYDGH